MEIVCALAAAGVCLDETPVYAAALLHDVSKGTPDHALAGAGLMSQLGYPVLAPLIAQHHDIEDRPGWTRPWSCTWRTSSAGATGA